MKYDFDDLYEGPRFLERARKRKIKLIVLSIASIFLLFMLIGVISFITADGPEKDHTAVEGNKEIVDEEDREDEEKTSNEREIMEESTEKPAVELNDSTKKDRKPSPNLDQEVTNSDKKTNSISHDTEKKEPAVIGTIQEDWKPVGTNQQGVHTTDFTEGSDDWNEMKAAVSVATSLPENNMIVWWMGNGGGPDKVVSTVSTKDKQTYYRVQLEWVDNQGWKPVKLEQLDGNDRATEVSSSETTETLAP